MGTIFMLINGSQLLLQAEFLNYIVNLVSHFFFSQMLYLTKVKIRLHHTLQPFYPFVLTNYCSCMHVGIQMPGEIVCLL